jgi:hypothetical protein
MSIGAGEHLEHHVRRRAAKGVEQRVVPQLLGDGG